MAQRLYVTPIARQNARQFQQEAVNDFEAQFEKHWPGVYGVLCRLLGDADQAEDVALEVFWRLYQASLRPGDRSPDNLVAWLYRVAMNLGYNTLRADKRRARYEEEAGRFYLANASSDPAGEVELSQERGLVRQILAEMKPRSAQLLLLRHAGLSYSEVAQALGLAPGSVGTLLARAENEFSKRFHQLKARRGTNL